VFLDLLAQTVETAEKGLSLLEKINAGGVPLLSLVIAVVAGIIAFKFYRDKTELETAFRDRVQELLTDQITATGDNATSQAKANQVMGIFQTDASEIKTKLGAVETKLTAVEMELRLLQTKFPSGNS
tara:strand:- start:654 stop:1034 length:381 start_codon:yes stop_codon:yes gene_type:complete